MIFIFPHLITFNFSPYNFVKYSVAHRSIIAKEPRMRFFWFRFSHLGHLYGQSRGPTGTWSYSATPEVHDCHHSLHRNIPLRNATGISHPRHPFGVSWVQNLKGEILHEKSRPYGRHFSWRAHWDLNPGHPA